MGYDEPRACVCVCVCVCVYVRTHHSIVVVDTIRRVKHGSKTRHKLHHKLHHGGEDGVFAAPPSNLRSAQVSKETINPTGG